MEKGLKEKGLRVGDNIVKTPVLTAEQRAAFDKEFTETSDSQPLYEEIVAKLMKRKRLNEKDAAALTGLNESLFLGLDKPDGKIEKRFVVSIGVGFQLGVHLTQYILESAGMKFRQTDRLDKAYMYILENCKGKDIPYCNGVLRDLGIEEKYMLGELTKGPYRKRAKAD